MKSWGTEHLRAHKRSKNLSVPPAGNANFAWVQPIVPHLSPTRTARCMLANAGIACSQPGEAEIGKNPKGSRWN
ncbi:MAG: hypothetical protein KatS3mg077_1074 [Candidatus Binatia bacterium]|nr:MAG: hypothetical protein KatS3mg077_1074 [Candidatus Binatia bacterium]